MAEDWIAGDWTLEAEAAIDLCTEWAANNVTTKFSCGVYLFGSAIYQGGDQFDAQLSDLDIVVQFHDDIDTSSRVDRLIELRDQKIYLELQMIPTLHRNNCVDPGVSVLPVSRLEIEANIHKSGARRFFDKNIFLDLSTNEHEVGLAHAGTVTLPDENRHALEFAQKTRNQFLAVSGNATGGILAFDGADPLPKELARVAAQLNTDAAEGEWYDTRLGLEILWEEVFRRKSESDRFHSLYTTLSKRRGGKGKRPPLTDADQLLLSEILYDRAVATPVDPVLIWEIQFIGGVFTLVEISRILGELTRLVPDSQILGTRIGSIIFRIRSSKRSYMTVKKLSDLGALPKFFDVDGVKVSALTDDDEVSAFDAVDPVGRLAEFISSWQPRSTESHRDIEAEFAGLLNEWGREVPGITSFKVDREVVVGDGPPHRRFDFLVHFGTPSNQDEKLVIEIVRIHRRATFFQHLDRVADIGLPTILVILGAASELEKLHPRIRQLARLGIKVRVITIPIKT